MPKYNVYRNGRIHVCRRMCSTCIFRPDVAMDLRPGRVESMVAEATANDGCIPCHNTIHGNNGNKNAVCRGFFDRHKTATLQIAERLNCVNFVEIAEDHYA